MLTVERSRSRSYFLFNMVESVQLKLDTDAYKQTSYKVEEVARSCLVLVVHYCFLCLRSENRQLVCKWKDKHTLVVLRKRKYDTGATVLMEPDINRI